MVRWTPETHEALLVAIAGSGLLPSLSGASFQAIINAWPSNRGPAPTRSALSQQLAALNRKHGARATGAGGGNASRGRTTQPRVNPQTQKPGRENHHVDMVSEDDEEMVDSESADSKVKIEKANTTMVPDIVDSDASMPTFRGMARSVAATTNSTTIPRAGLSPAAGLGNTIRPQPSPVDLTTDSERNGRKTNTTLANATFVDDAFAHLPMSERSKLLKQGRLDRWKHTSSSRRDKA